VYPDLEYVRAVEVQRRGLIHHHVVVWSATPLGAGHVQAVAMKAGYGCVMDLAPLDNAEKSARYLAKYVSKALDLRGEVPWVRQRVDRETGEITWDRTPTYRAGQSSHGWEMKMRDLRDIARRAAALAAARDRELAVILAAEAPTDDGQPVGNGTSPPT
jgi:hypothetical protein